MTFRFSQNFFARSEVEPPTARSKLKSNALTDCAIDFPRWVERLIGQIKEREGAKEGTMEDKNVGSGEGELSSVAEEDTVETIPGGDNGHSQEDEGSLADAESTSDTLAYEG